MAEEKQLVAESITMSLHCDACEDVSVTVQYGKVQGEEKLYHCSECNKIFCEDCGIFLHRKNRKGHSFDIEESKHVQSLQQMIEKREDEKEYGVGKKLVVALIGEENCRRIQPYLTASNALGSASVAGMVLLSDLVNNSGGLIAVSSTRAAMFGGIGVAVVSVLEIGYAGFRWYRGEICGKEFLRLSGKIIIKNGAAFGGIALGAKIGAAVGTAFIPGVGTAVGIVGGAILGFAFGWAASKIYEYFFPNGEQAARKKAVEDALEYFHFDKKDIKKKHIFNEKELRRRFRQYALDAHPDRNDGETKKWVILSGHYGTLRGLLEETKKKKKNEKIVDKVLAIKD